jgi:hypothetical protein
MKLKKRFEILKRIIIVFSIFFLLLGCFSSPTVLILKDSNTSKLKLKGFKKVN